MSLSLQLLVNLTDVNDNSPQFSAVQPVQIEENRLSGSTITTVTATDADQGTNAVLMYEIVDGDDFSEFVQL